MIFNKMTIFSTLLICAAPAIAMKRNPEADLLANPAQQLKTTDTRSLHEIYEEGNFNAFIECLHNGADPNEIGPDGISILRTTQFEGKFNDEQQKRAFEELKKHGANVNARTPGCGLSLVHDAARYEKPEWVAFYLNAGVSPHLVDYNDYTALWYVTGRQEIMGMLFRAGIDVAATEGISQRTALFDAATITLVCREMAEGMIIRNPHIVIKKDAQNETAYEYAARTQWNPNPDLQNEETSRKIIERRVFPEMTKSIHPGPVNITTGFMRARETGNRKFNINQLEPRRVILQDSGYSTASSGDSWDSSGSSSDGQD